MTSLGHTAEGQQAPGAAQELDAELLALPAPPRGRRLATLTLMALVTAGALGLVTRLGADIQYFFASSRAVDLGAATEADPASMVPNTYARVRGMPMASLMVSYRTALSGREYAVFPLAGQRHVLARVPVDDAEQLRTSSRRELSGRLVTVGQLGARFEPVRAFLAREMAVPITSETFVLLVDEPPARYGWALVLAGVGLVFVLVNVVLLVRWFRPLRDVTR